MFFRATQSRRNPWPLMDGRVWVMLILLLGMLVSSLGHANSHGLAAIAEAQHDNGMAHGHSHDDEPDGFLNAEDAGHAHHNSADHSHDKAYALPISLSNRFSAMAIWRSRAHPLEAGRVAFRLDRPPKA